MSREGVFHHLIIVSYPRPDKRSKRNGCAIQHNFMLLTVRYVTTDVNDNNEPDNIRINETFLDCIEAANQTAKSLENDVLNFLNALDINLAKCRGQGYDEAANMSGAINLTPKALQSPKIDLENAKTMLNSSLTSIENLRNNFANIKEEAIGLAKKWGITPEFEKKRHRKVRQFFDDFNADEKLQDRERLFEMDVFKANVDVITTQLKNRFESMNGIYKSFSFLSPKNIVSTTNDLLYNEAMKSI
ncbi:uncharacterized protein TNIN_359571 [Trichonephila inaurata madagascariensis]|uniref:Uncharacterized protein n=1 Tax=Trichonephila inaurata madagascariensis TaxID=2747483 RepID=A0A8X6XCY0_9ARAC|nr:uncharacterized protein TNIN_359571 [Trichonephila inaurata madagascariensis]